MVDKNFIENSNLLPFKYMDFRQTLGEMGMNCINLRNVYFFQDIALVQDEGERNLLNLTQAYYHLK